MINVIQVECLHGFQSPTPIMLNCKEDNSTNSIKSIKVIPLLFRLLGPFFLLLSFIIHVRGVVSVCGAAVKKLKSIIELAYNATLC